MTRHCSGGQVVNHHISTVMALDVISAVASESTLNVSSQYQATSVLLKEIGQKLLWSTGCC